MAFFFSATAFSLPTAAHSSSCFLLRSTDSGTTTSGLTLKLHQLLLLAAASSRRLRRQLLPRRAPPPQPQLVSPSSDTMSMLLNGNSLTGTVPMEVLSLVLVGNLTELNVASNNLDGSVGSTGFRVTAIIQDTLKTTG
ncbi:hypothetical protein GUJ93_ZPchr0005g15533 [Zizania palustris]|uniref:Uncharacterized protein n=1 Tax=Zizania palustris TaxID=103762 RepID=A0A8J5SPZ9_ZIZPA|nr:hypothetical protein GUJ93_ZPchr0005g15533 [Zizania palustris]